MIILLYSTYFLVSIYGIITNYYMYSQQEDNKEQSVQDYLSQCLNMHSFIEAAESTQNLHQNSSDKDQNIINSCQISILQPNFDNSLTKYQSQKSHTIKSQKNNKQIVQQSLSMLLKQYEQRIKTEIDSQNYRNDKLIKKLKSTIETNQEKIRQKTNKLIEIEEKFKKHEANYKKELIKLENSLQQFKKYFESTYDYTIKRMLDVEQKVSILSELSQSTSKQTFLKKTKEIAENVLSIVNSCVLESSKNRSMTLQKIQEVITKSQFLEQQISEMKIETLVLKNYKIKKECIEQHIDRLKDTAKMWESTYGENNNSFILTEQTYNDSSIKVFPSPKINDLQQKIINLKKQIQTYEQTSAQNYRKIQSLTQQIQEKNVKIANLDEIIDNLRCQLLSSKQQTQKCIDINDFSQQKLEKIEAQYRSIEIAMGQQIRVLKQMIKKKQAEIKILRGTSQIQYRPLEHLYTQSDEEFKKIIKKKSELSFGIRQSFDHSLQFSISPANSVSKLSQKINRHSVDVSNKNEDEKRMAIQRQLEQVNNYNEQLLKENKILLNAVNQLQRSYGDCLGFLQMHERKSRQMETVIQQLHEKSQQYQKINILLQGQNQHLKEELSKEKKWRLKKKMAQQDTKLLTKLTALSKKYDQQEQNYPLTYRQPAIKSYHQIEQNFERKYGETERLPGYQKQTYDYDHISQRLKSKTKDKSLKKKTNFKVFQPRQSQTTKYLKYNIFTQPNSQYQFTDRSLSSKNSSIQKKNLRTTPRVETPSVQVEKKYPMYRVDNAVIWSLKRSIQRMNIKMPAICQIDRTGYLKSIQSRTYIINQKGSLFNLNNAQLDLAERKRIITLMH